MRFLKKKMNLDPNRFTTSSGKKCKKTYSPFYDGKKMSLVESGEIDLPSLMSERAKACDMNFILSRLAHGDMSVLNQKQPVFADFHNLPSNFREVLDIGLNAERIFNDLPLAVRQQFDHDYRRFVSSAGSREWLNIMYPDGNIPGASQSDQNPSTDNLIKEK